MTPNVQSFFDDDTNTISYVVSDPATGACAIIDPVLNYDAAAARTATISADRVIDHVSGSQGAPLRIALCMGWSRGLRRRCLANECAWTKLVRHILRYSNLRSLKTAGGGGGGGETECNDETVRSTTDSSRPSAISTPP